jgi:DNA-binding NtrC family response regulator
MKNQVDDHPGALRGRILLVTKEERARNLADVLGAQLGVEVEVAEGRKVALSALRRGDFTVVLIDEAFADLDLPATEAILLDAGLAVPLQINVALSGARRIVREVRAALLRREQEITMARRAAAEAIENELSITVAGLLLHSQLALREGEPIPDALRKKIRAVAELSESIRASLAEQKELAS